ncbi:polyketide cyclase [Tumebacillus algifaecis]|uniref:Polyketide cyclase n=1 Tax=Tumebacillus algifaecis TaxID=1214604 RepID=A0A223D1S9_9BACL|nr:SRPBCC domain-containing protein [Tumebacillus algifaecis]ASS75511.1 polyketide cyclase [Tumebacillus algifaecis]
MSENMESNNELVLTRTFDAPRELVFKVWSEAEHLMHWWGPKGFKMEVAAFDFRPGGVFHYSQQTPDGQKMWGKFVFQEMVAPEKLVFINSFSDAEGNLVRAPFNATWPLEILNTLTFEEHDGKTTLTMRGYPVNATEEERQTFESMRGGIQQGFAGTFNQLTEYLASVQTK